ncbi:MAG: hypothetical protein ACK53I_16530 [Phenylobacterium sp.]
MKQIALAAALISLAGCATDGTYSSTSRSARYYDYNRPDPSYGGYDAGRYYRENSAQRERRLSRNERVYRGQDGRYYCRRSDGTTGLIVGAIAGGVLGNILAPGGSETLGTSLGAGAGALAGPAMDSREVR